MIKDYLYWAIDQETNKTVHFMSKNYHSIGSYTTYNNRIVMIYDYDIAIQHNFKEEVI